MALLLRGCARSLRSGPPAPKLVRRASSGPPSDGPLRGGPYDTKMTVVAAGAAGVVAFQTLIDMMRSSNRPKHEYKPHPKPAAHADEHSTTAAEHSTAAAALEPAHAEPAVLAPDVEPAVLTPHTEPAGEEVRPSALAQERIKERKMAAIQRRSTMKALMAEEAAPEALPETLPELPSPSPVAQVDATIIPARQHAGPSRCSCIRRTHSPISR